MGVRPSLNPYCEPDLVTDKLIGNAYPTVRHVSENMEYVKHVSYHLREIYTVFENIEGIQDLSVLGENLPQLMKVAEHIDALVLIAEDLPALADYANIAETSAIAAEASAISANSSAATATNAADQAQFNATNSSNSATAAANAYIGAASSEENAHNWAQAPEDEEVNDGEHTGYSAFHWAKKAEFIVGDFITADYLQSQIVTLDYLIDNDLPSGTYISANNILGNGNGGPTAIAAYAFPSDGEALPLQNTIPIYGPDGRLKVGYPTQPSDAVNLDQLINSINSLTAQSIGALPDTYVAPVQSVNGKTGAVELDGRDIIYNSSSDPELDIYSVVNSLNAQIVTVTTDLDALEELVPATVTVGGITVDTYYPPLTTLTGLDTQRVLTAVLQEGKPYMTSGGPLVISSGNTSPSTDTGAIIGARTGSLTSADKPTSNTTQYWVVNLRMLNERFSYASRQAIDALDPDTATLADLINALQA